MEIIWKYGKVFTKDIIDSYPEPKPAGTTVATLLKRMQNKGVIAYKLFGKAMKNTWRSIKIKFLYRYY